MALLLRLLGGEPILSFPAAIKYPWYDEPSNTQYFPFKTTSMLIGFLVLLLVSYLTDRLIKPGRLQSNVDSANNGYDVTSKPNEQGEINLYSITNQGAAFSSADLENSNNQTNKMTF